ncbi:hypothetical protein NZL82_07475 [Sphingomonas sanguinis]|uniref:hypothetical protein n=1 Tax=Sphingomonas sp. LC-1 TaxID=3110957 RepID=UPI0021BB1706|nr:hypothetical protein [Sphingomonas sp. LC-1]MCT8001718.1 hypothetical protein [Sphingomonas sp. LC-1]
MTSDLRLLHWPEDDRASFTQFTVIMTEVQARIQAISGEAGGVPVPRPPREPTPRECAAMILRHRRGVRAMARADGDLFGDPAWEILLAIFAADVPQSETAILEAAGFAPDGLVGARWVRLLMARDWVARTLEGRLRLTDKGLASLSAIFEQM